MGRVARNSAAPRWQNWAVASRMAPVAKITRKQAPNWRVATIRSRSSEKQLQAGVCSSDRNWLRMRNEQRLHVFATCH